MRTLFLLFLAASALQAQTYSPLNCVATSVPALVRVEGVAERVGDIVLNCNGGTPNGLVRGDLRVISYTGNITNKLNPATGALDAVLTVNLGAGEVSTPHCGTGGPDDTVAVDFTEGQYATIGGPGDRVGTGFVVAGRWRVACAVAAESHHNQIAEI